MTDEDHLARYRLNRQKLKSQGSVDCPGAHIQDEERDRGNERSVHHVFMGKASTPIRSGRSKNDQVLSIATPKDDELSAQSEMPFDMMQDIGKPQGLALAPQTQLRETVQHETYQDSLEPIRETSHERGGKAYTIDGRVQHGVFMLPPPRYSGPTLIAESTARDHPAQTPEDMYPSYGNPGQLVDERVSINRDPASNDSDQDSLFDFEEERAANLRRTDGLRNAKPSQRIRRRVAANREQSMGGDDTSLDTYGHSPVTLHERSQQAWKSRQKKNSSFRARKTKTANNVSFGGKDTVQYFNPHVDEQTAGTMEQFEERSLNSEYTKTVESEVEDMIKDILLIGNPSTSQPGRRKFKYKPEIKKRNRDRQAELKRRSEESSMSQTDGNQVEAISHARSKSKYGDAQRSKGSRGSNRKASQKSKVIQHGSANEEGDFLWDMVEGGVNVVSSALGLAEESSRTKSKSGAGDSSSKSESLALKTSPGPTSTGEQLTEAFEYAQDFVYAALDGSNESSNNTGSNSNDSMADRPSSILVNGLLTRENIAKLALHAARSLHQSQGVEFDGSHAIVIEKDVFMSTVELKLPLGLIFLENDGGCFVTKVSPDGSASRCGGVEVGDQLAAINGLKSINTKVDDICKAIAISSDPKTVIMMFIRYIGPFRPLRSIKKKVPNSDTIVRTAVKARNSNSMSPQRNGEKESAKSSGASNNANESKKRGFRLFGRGNKKGP